MDIVERSSTAGVTATERGGVGAQRRGGGDGRHERRAGRVNDGDRAERRERRRDQALIRGGVPRGRQESDERGGEGKEGGEGGRVPALTPAAAATDGGGRRACGGDAPKQRARESTPDTAVDGLSAVRRDDTIAAAASATGRAPSTAMPATASAAAAAAGAPPPTSSPDRPPPSAGSGASPAA